MKLRLKCDGSRGVLVAIPSCYKWWLMVESFSNVFPSFKTSMSSIGAQEGLLVLELQPPRQSIMALEGESGSSKPSSVSAYDEAMDALSSLITKKNRSHKYVADDRFERMFDYVKIVDLEEPISQMKIIHVAGTKGKGSTCVFTEAILRNYGFHTGLFTSPHLIDVRERFRLNG
ncbi:hypothetical protein R6Q57_021510 [Mikania cordata]